MKKNSCTPINPKKYSCYGLKKNSYKEFDNEKFPKIPLPTPHNFSNGPSLKIKLACVLPPYPLPPTPLDACYAG